MTDQKCKNKKTLEMFPPDRQPFPLEERTFFLLFLNLSLSKRLGMHGLWSLIPTFYNRKFKDLQLKTTLITKERAPLKIFCILNKFKSLLHREFQKEFTSEFLWNILTIFFQDVLVSTLQSPID